MGWFFTKAALLIFGSAYAVLPYVFQGAVQTRPWLSATQMMDGLALGETTSGPLIMVVAFVGFFGGWTKAVVGPVALFLGGAAAAVVGVIANLAIFFAWNMLWPKGFSSLFDWALALIVAGASIALFRFKIGIMPLPAVCAALGLANQLAAIAIRLAGAW